MNMEFPKDKSPGESPDETLLKDATQQQQPSLDDEHTQAAYRKAYLEQLRRQACPGCGETEIFF